MANIKLCPLAKTECIEEQCAWYVTELEKCSIKLLAIVADCVIDTAQNILEDKTVYYEKNLK